MKAKENIQDIIKFDEKGLVPVIVQDYQNGQVLMFAWANSQSLGITMQTNLAHYFSRSRQKLWQKGETSGNSQNVQEILIDCDNDCLIFKVKQQGVACHTGAKSCFF
jgi:phosphoribosyl-ATP pyrophosphohydrolase/phosphoribosyl-AMP cyclohydrolase